MKPVLDTLGLAPEVLFIMNKVMIKVMIMFTDAESRARIRP